MKGEYERRLYEEKINTLKRYLGIVDSWLKYVEEFKIPKEKMKYTTSLAIGYYLKIKKRQPQVLIIGEYHTDICHSFIEGFLISYCKPKYILMEYFGKRTEEEVEEYIKNISSQKISEEVFYLKNFLESLPDAIYRKLGSKSFRTIIKNYIYQ